VALSFACVAAGQTGPMSTEYMRNYKIRPSTRSLIRLSFRDQL
jgi:hypothetical protein